MSVAYALRSCWFIRGSRNVITMQHFVSNALVARNGDCSKKISWSICHVYKLNNFLHLPSNICKLSHELILKCLEKLNKIHSGKRSTALLATPSRLVGPDWAKFRHYDKKSKVSGLFLRAYLVLNLLWLISYAFGQISLLTMTKYWTNNTAIWSHRIHDDHGQVGPQVTHPFAWRISDCLAIELVRSGISQKLFQISVWHHFWKLGKQNLFLRSVGTEINGKLLRLKPN